MANKVTEVFRVTVPSVGLTLKVRGDIDGKQVAYSRRIKDDDRYDGGDDALLTEYSTNIDCKFNFVGGNPENDITFEIDEIKRLKAEKSASKNLRPSSPCSVMKLSYGVLPSNDSRG